MFAGRFFAARYFAPRYFPEVGSTPSLLGVYETGGNMLYNRLMRGLCFPG